MFECHQFLVADFARHQEENLDLFIKFSAITFTGIWNVHNGTKLLTLFYSGGTHNLGDLLVFLFV